MAWQIKRLLDETILAFYTKGIHLETKCAVASHPQEHTMMEKNASEC